MAVVRWTGAPRPEQREPESGYQWRYRVEAGVKGLVPPTSGYAPTFPSGRFLTLTTAFPHPADRPPRGRDDPDIFQRFVDDERGATTIYVCQGQHAVEADPRAPAKRDGE